MQKLCRRLAWHWYATQNLNQHKAWGANKLPLKTNEVAEWVHAGSALCAGNLTPLPFAPRCGGFCGQWNLVYPTGWYVYTSGTLPAELKLPMASQEFHSSSLAIGEGEQRCFIISKTLRILTLATPSLFTRINFWVQICILQLPNAGVAVSILSWGKRKQTDLCICGQLLRMLYLT